MAVGHWKESKYHGDVLIYNNDGSLQKATYINGLNHGWSLTTHYDGSTEKVQYKNGKKEGQELMAAPDGKIETVVTYENGEMTNAEEYEGDQIEE
jgi:antitoxin component YwqK of YwqJK toxin-antitoxin module